MFTSRAKGTARVPVLAALAVVAALAATTTLGVAPAAAAPPTPAAPRSCSDTTGTPYATGLIPLPCLPVTPGGPTRWTDNGQLLLTPGPANLFVGERRLARLFTLICGNSGGGFLACPANVAGPLPPAATPAISVVEQIFLQSRPGAALQYGELARVPVDQLTAAGRVQGTLVLSQASTAGVVSPVLARQVSGTLLYPPGTTVPGFEQFGPNPGPGNAQVQGDVTGNGPASAVLTGLTLDGRALDAGGCQAVGTLSVSARGGWAVGAPAEGGPAEYRPFSPPSYLHARLRGVRAQGCDTLDPSVTQVLLDNASFLQQVSIDFTAASPVTAYGCLAGATAGCASRHPAVVDPARVPAQL